MFNVLHKLKAAVDANILTPDEAETMVKALLFVHASGHDAGTMPDKMRFYMFKWPDQQLEDLLKNTDQEPPAPPKKSPALGGLGLGLQRDDLDNS